MLGESQCDEDSSGQILWSLGSVVKLEMKMFNIFTLLQGHTLTNTRNNK